jgi:chromosome segregation ATPase
MEQVLPAPTVLTCRFLQKSRNCVNGCFGFASNHSSSPVTPFFCQVATTVLHAPGFANLSNSMPASAQLCKAVGAANALMLKLLLEALAVQSELRKTVEQATGRASVQDQALRDATSRLDQAKAEVLQLSARSQEQIIELAAAREELSALRVQRAADQDRLQEYQAEIAALRTRDHAREDEVRRLNEDLRAAERREVEANQRANSLQLEIERLRGQFESEKTHPKSEAKDTK